MGERPDGHGTSAFLERGAVLAILLLALVLRARSLDEWWLNPDEGIYYSTVTRATFAAFWTEVAANAHPPLYYLVLRVLGVVTWDFLWFRGVSVVCGLGLVLAVWAVGRELGGPVAGVVAAALLALSPAAVALSQVMRPYSLQLALLAASLWCLLRHLRAPSPRTLAGYLALLCLALLTHYSSVLALGVFALLVAHDGLVRGIGRKEWRTLALAHVLPVVLVGILYLVHLRPLLQTQLARDSLGGWLSYYMVRSPREAWLAFLGFQSLLGAPRVRGPLALLLLAAVAASAARGDRRPLLLGVGGVLAAFAGAAAGLYPMGATRHAAWLMVFTVPVLGWLAARIWSLGTRTRAAALALAGGLFLLGDPVGHWLGRDLAPWSPDDRILRKADLAAMSDVIDPEGGPDLVVMSGQTFYLLIPFYPHEREEASFSRDSTVFRFHFGRRKIVAASAWELNSGDAPPGGQTLSDLLERADRDFGDVDLAEDSTAVLLVGGWTAPLVGELTELSRKHPFLLGRKEVPGLVALRLDVGRYLEAAADDTPRDRSAGR